jgi:hypothetical protein
MAEEPAQGLADEGADGTCCRRPRRMDASVFGEMGLYPDAGSYAANVHEYPGVTADLYAPVPTPVTQR